MAEALLTSDVSNEDTPQRLLKRILYKKYLQAFIPITQYQFFKTMIIDGNAGSGRYGSEHEDWPVDIEGYGSPLIAMMVSLNYFYHKQHRKEKIWGKATEDRYAGLENMFNDVNPSDKALPDLPIPVPKIYLYFVENDKRTFNKLKDTVADLLGDFFQDTDWFYTDDCDGKQYEFQIKDPKYPIYCKLVNTEFSDFDPPSPMTLSDMKCLTFIDPYGFTNIPISHAQKFVNSDQELLVNFRRSYLNGLCEQEWSVGQVAELYGIDELLKLAGKRRAVTKHENDSLETFVNYIVSNSNVEWSGTLENGIQSCSANYERMLREVCHTDYALGFEMRGQHDVISYRMIFVTHNNKGIERMKEAMNRCSQVVSEMVMSDYTFCRNGLKLNLGNFHDDTSVADTIYLRFEGCYKQKLSDIKEFVLLDTPYVFRKEHLSVMVTEDDPRVTHVFDNDGKSPETTGSFPDSTTWYLNFQPAADTISLADSIYAQWQSRVHIPMSDIKAWSQYHFKESALAMMATEENTPRILAVCYTDGPVPKRNDIFSNDREWFITFRPALTFNVDLPYKRVPFN